ncbi:MAG: aspartyl protease [Cyanobacteria bacterium P01_G01_bin.54]
MPTPTAATMGKILTTVTIINRVDQILASRQVITPEEIRSLTLKNVLVDIRATTLCLPPEAIAQLGLEILKEVDVTTAAGLKKAKIFPDAKISLLGREGTFDCLERPGGSDALLDVIPLESLGIEPDLQNQKLKLLPTESQDTYLTIL